MLKKIQQYEDRLDLFFFSSRRRHTRWTGDWSSDVCSSDLAAASRIASLPADDVESLSGLGAEGRVNGHTIVLGNHRLFEERRLCSPALHDRLRSEERRVGKEGRERGARHGRGQRGAES